MSSFLSMLTFSDATRPTHSPSFLYLPSPLFAELFPFKLSAPSWISAIVSLVASCIWFWTPVTHTPRRTANVNLQKYQSYSPFFSYILQKSHRIQIQVCPLLSVKDSKGRCYTRPFITDLYLLFQPHVSSFSSCFITLHCVPPEIL